MTNSNERSRLDRIEAIIETQQGQIQTITSAIASQQGRVETVEGQLQTLVSTIANQQGQIDSLARSLNQTGEFVLEISRAVRQQAESQQRIVEQQQRMMDSIEAELTRQGRILDYLLGQQNG